MYSSLLISVGDGSILLTYILPRLCFTNINRSNRIKCFPIKKDQILLKLTDADYADDLAFLANTPFFFLPHCLRLVAVGIGFYVNTDKIEFMHTYIHTHTHVYIYIYMYI